MAGQLSLLRPGRCFDRARNISQLTRDVAKREPSLGTAELQNAVLLWSPASQAGLREFAAPPMLWREMFEALPLPETIARSARMERAFFDQHGRHRTDDELSKDSPLVPEWYKQYLDSDRWTFVKEMAASRWPASFGCVFNADHNRENWHHRQYDRIGIDNEWLDVVPICRRCHDENRQNGPRVPKEPSKDVMQWI